MKRFLTFFCTVLVLCSALCATAAASDFDALAQELAAIGMFRGTGESFELDREPTRAEAAVMLVRLYGAEEQAQADYAGGVITHPFTDVANWTAPYVAWLYTNGLTKGMSDTAFGSANVCTDLNYTTFLLRALGYQDGVDFAYKDALTFAQELGFYDAETFAGPFLRDDLAALTYQALATEVKSGDTYLLAQLIANGAVDADAAQPMTEKMDAWHSFSKTMLDEYTAFECETVMNYDAVLTLNDTETTDLSMSTTVYAAMVGSGETLQYAEVITVNYMGIPAKSAVYFKDGWVYSATYLGDLPMEQYKYPVSFDELSEEELSADSGVILPSSYGGILGIDDITVENKLGSTVYTITMNGTNLTSALMEMIGGLVTESLGEITSLQFDDIKVSYAFDANGQLRTSNVSFAICVELVSYEDEEPVYMRLDTQYDASVTYIAWNEDVEITFPDDLSNYQEVSEEDYVYE